MAKDSEHGWRPDILPPGPWVATENRVFAADGEEIGVATRASSRWRKSANWTALALASVPRLANACKVMLLNHKIRAFLRANDPKAMSQMIEAVVDVYPDIFRKITDADHEEDKIAAGRP